MQTTIEVPGEVERFTLTARVERTERERTMGIASESRRALRAHYEAAFPTARIRITGPERADADSLWFVVEVVL